MNTVEDRLMLHDLRGVNLKVDFFLGTREELCDHQKCFAYTLCWKSVDVRVDQVTRSESISGLNFYSNTQQLFIDDFCIRGDVFSFYCEKESEDLLTAYCKILVGRN